MNTQYAFKTRAFPNKNQQEFLMECFRAARWAYNFGLMTWEEKYKAGEKINAQAIDKLWSIKKKEKEYMWTYNVPSCVTQQAIKKHLDRAFKNFFERIKKGGKPGYPKYKDRNRSNSAEFTNASIKPQHIFFLDRKVQLPKGMGKLRVGDLPRQFSKLNCTTISHDGCAWYISFQIEGNKEISVAKGDIIGIDVGVACFAVGSNGVHYPDNKIDYEEKIRRSEKRVEELQKKLSEKTYITKNGRQCYNKSNNVDKLRKKISKAYAKAGRLRLDRIHKVSARLAREYNRVAVENLNLKKMTASAKGTNESPGTMVKQKSGLNRAMLRQGIGEFFRVLDYKLSWAGGALIQVDPRYTSQTCPACGHIAKQNRPTRDKFKCVECGFSAHADHVGAINILNRAA